MSETTLTVTPNQQITVDEIRKFIVGQKMLDRVPKNQIDIAIETARAYNLNPFKREVHFTAYNGEIKIIVGYEVYLKRAEATHKLNGWKVDIQGQGADMKAVVTIHRKDWEFPFEHEVYKTEVAQNTPIWLKMPRFMLKKVAIGQAFRLAFPEEMGGMPYMEEELPDMGTPAQLIERDDDVSEQPGEAVEDVTPTCEECKKTLTTKVADYSKSKFGRYLCTTHQKTTTHLTDTSVNPSDIDASLPATDEQKAQIRQLIKDGRLDERFEEKVDTATYANAAKLLELAHAKAEPAKGATV